MKTESLDRRARVAFTPAPKSHHEDKQVLAWVIEGAVRWHQEQKKTGMMQAEP